MSTIVTRSGKGSPLTNTEVDANFTNLNTDKLEISGGTMTGNIAHAGDFTIDAGSNITLDADGGSVFFKDAGTEFFKIRNTGSDVQIYSARPDADMKFEGVDGSVGITALTLDMSNAGAATFSGDVTLAASKSLTLTSGQLELGANYRIKWGGSNNYSIMSDNNHYVQINADGEDGLRVARTESTFNEGGIDRDFRVESDSNTHMLFVDAGKNAVGINTNSPKDDAVMTIQDGGLAGAAVLRVSADDNSPYTFVVGNEAHSTSTSDGLAQWMGSDGGARMDVRGGSNQYYEFRLGGAEVVKFHLNNGYVFNESGGDRDFRVESGTSTHALFVDAGSSEVGINQSNPLAPLHVNGGVTMAGGWIRTQYLEALFPTIVFHSTYATDSWGGIGYDSTNQNMDFWLGATSENISADNAKKVLRLRGTDGFVWNDTGENNLDFRVEGDTKSHLFFIDAGTDRIGINRSNPSFMLDIKMKDADRGGGFAIRRHDNDAHQLGLWTSGGTMYYDNITDNSSASGVAVFRHSRDVGATFTESIRAKDTEVVINEASANLDFRVESDSNASMLFVDASENKVGINNGSPLAALDVKDQINVTNASNGSMLGLKGTRFAYSSAYKVLQVGDDTGNYSVAIGYDPSGNPDASFSGNGGEILFRHGAEFLVANNADTAFLAMYRMLENESVFNEDGRDINFRVESDSNTHMLFVDAGSNRVGINDSTPSYPLDVNGTASIRSNLILGSSSNDPGILTINDNSSTAYTLALKGTGTREYNFEGSSSGGEYNLYMNNASVADGFNLHVYGSGIFNQNGDDYDFRVESNNNANMLFVDAGNDRIGVGTSNPLAVLDIHGNTNAYSTMAKIYLTDVSGHVDSRNWSIGNGGSAYGAFTIGLSNAAGGDPQASGTHFNPFLITKEGNVVFNEDSKDADFRVESNNHSNMLFVDASEDVIAFGRTQLITGGGMYFNHNNATRSHLVVSNTETSYAESLYYGNRQNSDGHVFQFRRQNYTVGNISVNSSGTTYNTTSDRRLKDNIEPIADATDKLMSMKPVTHTWIADPEAPAVHGFIAQEMQEVVPEAVSGEDGGEEMMSMDYGRITPVLVAALQDAHNKITALEERLTKMEVN